MNTAKQAAIVATLKSIGRGLWFSVLGLVVVALTAFATSGAVSDVTVTIAGLNINLAYIILAVVASLAKIIDTYIHKNQAIASNGIAPGFLQNDPGTKAVQTAPVVITPQQTPPAQPTAPTVTQIPVSDAPSDQTPPSAPLNS